MEWRSVVGYEGIYEVSDEGLVRGVTRSVASCHGSSRVQQGKLLSLGENKTGYTVVRLRGGVSDGMNFVHRIVAFAFIPNPDGKPFINHIDFNRANNRASNLEWVTSSENNAHTRNAGRARHRPKQSMPVIVTFEGSEISYQSARVAAEANGLKVASVYTAIHTGDKIHGRLVRYANSPPVPKKQKLTVSEAAIRVLLRTQNPAVMAGDEGLLHEIATELGWDHNAWHTSDRVVHALTTSPGRLIVSKTFNGRRNVNLFSLPDRKLLEALQ